MGSYLSLENENVTSRSFSIEFLFYFFLVSLCREVRPLNEIWLLYCHWCTIIILTEISKQQSYEQNIYRAEIFFLKYAK